MISRLLADLPPERPVLIAGPTASGKSALALAIAEAQGGTIVNADASQVYDCWRVITARPGPEDEARAAHALYGHHPYDARYSVGDWLREVAPLLARTRPIVIGGTGLAFAALTEGLADIPEVPEAVRREADGLDLDTLRAGVARETLAGLDPANRARVQRAWEVERATGRALHLWQAETAPPLLPLERASAFVLDAPKAWLTPRIARRFRAMLDAGALEEARAMQTRYDPTLQSCKAIGVRECMSVLDGTLTEAEAAERATIATRRYAKRQRTWFRARMSNWIWTSAEELAG